MKVKTLEEEQRRQPAAAAGTLAARKKMAGDAVTMVINESSIRTVERLSGETIMNEGTSVRLSSFHNALCMSREGGRRGIDTNSLAEPLIEWSSRVVISLSRGLETNFYNFTFLSFFSFLPPFFFFAKMSANVCDTPDVVRLLQPYRRSHLLAFRGTSWTKRCLLTFQQTKASVS